MEQKKFILYLSITCLVVLLTVSVQFFMEYRRTQTVVRSEDKSDLDVSPTKFPPSPAKCPDYWSTLPDGKCKNVKKVGICMTKDTADVMDFRANEIFKGEDGPLAKCNWSKQCEAPWEGIDTLC